MTNNTEDKMHGSIFVFLKRFVESSYDFSTWIKLLDTAGINHETYQMHGMYPTKELQTIVSTASELTGLSVDELQESFGRFLVPDLLLIYRKHLNPEWKTFQMLQYTEAVMHGAVRREDSRTNPPILSVSKVSNKLLIIDYHSKRRMASVAIGIIKGIAQYFQESDIVTVTPVTPRDAERVQLRIEFA
ncbi:heme NO-binding domain-containing protein [Pontibacter harenae]|uniref:heme NO-binding domain-containing protein n=1 Tax=Pontibacter harenae TaxID=2894083 RepID=UPI001E29C8E0|nr:heme NO-binding domain-containing protein [Pontibacter harenae]MCC9166251.1 heme NO-binding domain-containing protein [Pontibacter harenae]